MSSQEEDGAEDTLRVDFAYPFLSSVDVNKPPSSFVIPDKFLDLMSNMERQYWEIKCKNYDVLIFFKKGAFYELYDYDAVIGHKEFGLKMVIESSNRGKMRLAGVPEHSFSEWARLFVFRGYKVGRVEQMKESDEPVVGKQKVVPRKLVEIITPGTVVDLSMISDHNEIFLLTLCPVFVDQKRIVIDAFAVDMSRRVVHSCPCGKSDDLALLKEGKVSREISVSPLPDLPHTSLEPLTSLLQQLNPKEIIIPQLTDSKVNMYYCGKIAEWVAADGFKVGFFENTKNNVQLPPHFPQYSPGVPCAATVAFHYLLALHHDKDELGFLTEASEYVAHLNTQVKKEQFTSGDAVRSRTLEYERKYDMGLILDSSTVTNLEIVKNLQDGSEVGSLNALLNFCTTNGGRRLFRSWLLRPARTPKVIGDRLECVRFFLDHHFSEEWCSEDSGPSQSRKRQRESEENTLRCNFSAIMSIDFERILSRISAIKAESSSSISYVDPMVVYRRDLNLILLTVKSFVNLISWGSWFKKRLEELKVKLPTLLTELVDTILACQTSVEAISKLFDREAAETTGQLTPSFGTCPEYDDSVSRLNALEEKLHGARRKAQTELFGGAEVSFADLGKDIFLYEVSTSSAPKLTPKGLVERSRNAKAVRYIDSSLSSVVEAHKVAASAKASGLLGVLQKVAARICDYNTSLYEAAAALSYLDCLLNLSDLPRRWPSSHFPQLMECGDASAIQGENLVHPLMKDSTSSTPVPNSVTLDNSHGRVLVLTGPNMAGKSTLMRTLAVNVLLAQLGGPICGTGLSFSPVDRIFTRIGARDASHKGQSTLFVELNETAEILKHATSHSLCLIDELGRGTSTHDGMAIAQATLDAIQGHTPCAPLTIFSTHYHSIALELVRIRGTVKQEPLSTRAVQTGYMNFVLEKEDSAVKQEHPSAAAPSKVVFLYQLVPGVCDRSYGVEVARMAGVREPLLQLAALKSAEMAQRSAFHEDVQTIRQFLSQA